MQPIRKVDLSILPAPRFGCQLFVLVFLLSVVLVVSGLPKERLEAQGVDSVSATGLKVILGWSPGPSCDLHEQARRSQNSLFDGRC